VAGVRCYVWGGEWASVVTPLFVMFLLLFVR
jgi:hypothetical protein